MCDALRNPEPYPLEDVSGVLFRPDLRIECSLAGPDVGLVSLDQGRTLEELPEEVQHEVDWDADVGDDEVVDGPVPFCEDGETVEQL